MCNNIVSIQHHKVYYDKSIIKYVYIQDNKRVRYSRNVKWFFFITVDSGNDLYAKLADQ